VILVTLQPNNVLARRITVTVRPPTGLDVVAQGYRTNHT
jgi:hypothetical protein